MKAQLDGTVANLQRANAELQRQLDECRAERDEYHAERDEALEQQVATAEVLGVINSSPGDLAPVFDAMLEKAIHLCDAAFGTLWTRDGESFRAVALRRVPAEFADLLAKAPYRPEPGSGHERLMRGEPFVQVEDAAAEARIGPVRQALVERGGARSLVAVPLRKDGTILGVISAYRQEVRPFSDKQIALLQNFAAQAVIAMENARLITETREALEQQTAAAEVLGVINSSPGNLVPVFEAMLAKVRRLCGAFQGALRTFDGEAFHLAAADGEPDQVDRLRELGAIRVDDIGPGNPFELIVRGERVVHIVDLRNTEVYRSDPVARERIDTRGVRSWLTVALRRDEALVGTISVNRREVHPFSEREIALVRNFADQR